MARDRKVRDMVRLPGGDLWSPNQEGEVAEDVIRIDGQTLRREDGRAGGETVEERVIREAQAQMLAQEGLVPVEETELECPWCGTRSKGAGAEEAFRNHIMERHAEALAASAKEAGALDEAARKRLTSRKVS